MFASVASLFDPQSRDSRRSSKSVEREEKERNGHRSRENVATGFLFFYLVLQCATERCTVTSAGPTGWKFAGRGKIDCHSCVISISLPPVLISEI